MPIKNAAKKALRQTKKRRAKNIVMKENVKNLVKKFRKSLAAKKADEAKTLLPVIYKAIDKAAKNHIVKKNNAARLKSKLSRAFNKIAAKTK